MANEGFYEDEFIIYLTIDNTQYQEKVVKVTDPNKTIRDQIATIVRVCGLPKMTDDGEPIIYQLTLQKNGDEEPLTLLPENEHQQEQCFLDYDIQSGDHLHLIRIVTAG